MKFLSHSYFALGLLSLLGLLLISLSTSSPVNAKEFNGNTTFTWVGMSDSLAAFADDYDWYQDWTVSNFTYFGPDDGQIHTMLIKNISHHTSTTLYIGDSMHSNNKLEFSGAVDVQVNVCNTNSSVTYDMRQLDTSVLQAFNGNAFQVGIDKNTGIYDADSVTVRMIQNISTIQSNKQCVGILYRVSFTARYNSWTDSGYYYFNWRLNGNNRTNGGNGSMFAPVQMYPRQTLSGTPSNSLQFYVQSVDWTLDIAENGSPPADPSVYDKKFDELNQSLGDLKQQNNTIIGQNQEIINGQKETTEAIKEQTQQQENQYNQEKQEESDRENQGKHDSEQAQGIFNFNILNPFAPLFDMFNPSGCVQIPTLSDWLHTEDTQVCPWFPAKVRQVATPVLSIASMMLLFGFVVGWLNGRDLNGTVYVKGKN